MPGPADIIQNAISRISNRPSSASIQPTVDVSQLYSQGMTNRAMMQSFVDNQMAQQQQLDDVYGNLAIDPMYKDQYAPNTTSGINAGTYSGKTFSAPLLVSQGIVPLARFDAFNKASRDNEISKAERAAKISQGLFEKAQPDEITDPAYQESFNENFYAENDKFVQSYQKAFPENWQEMLTNSPEYNRFLSNSKLMARSANTVISEVANLSAEVSAGKKVITPQTQKMLDEIKNGLFKFGGNPAAITQDLVGFRNRVQAEEALGYIVESSGIIEKAQPLIEDFVYQMGNDKNGVKNLQIEKNKKFTDFVDQMTDELMRGQLAGSTVYNKKQIKDFLIAYLGSEVSTTFQSMQTGDMTAYQRQSVAQDWERLKLQKQSLDASGDKTKIDLGNRLVAVWDAKNGKSLGNAVGVQTSDGRVAKEYRTYVDPKDFQGWSNLSEEEKAAKWNDPTFKEKYKSIKGDIKANPEKYIGNTFVVAEVKKASGTGSAFYTFNTADPNFPGDYNNFLNGNDPAKTQVDNDLFKSEWDKSQYNTTSAGGGSGAKSTAYEIKGTSYTEKELLDMGYSLEDIAPYKKQ